MIVFRQSAKYELRRKKNRPLKSWLLRKMHFLNLNTFTKYLHCFHYVLHTLFHFHPFDGQNPVPHK